ncbi:MAG: hypothetical protein RIQ56_786 [Candidatus Parcubacteria bacterium]|jgi:pyruvate,water dikinase
MKQSHIYDNTNLAESYSGVVSPLTASFARDLYEGVYRHFCDFMGVSAKKKRQHDDMFRRMIVSIGYHLYYDINNWYTLVSMLPGYSYNKSFFEHMLGIPPGAAPEVKISGSKSVAKIRLLLQGLKIGAIFVVMPLLVRQFNRRFDTEFRRFGALDLKRMKYQELCAHYQTVRAELVRLWRVPIANDFAVMVSTGIARALHKKWLGDDSFAGHLLLSSRKNLASVDPGRNLLAIRRRIEALQLHSYLDTSLAPKEVYANLRRDSSATEIVDAIDAYILLYGSRVPNELKLEARTLHESPEEIIPMLRAASGVFEERIETARNVPSISGVSLLRRRILSFVFSWARMSIRYREETRLRRTQIFGHARQVFLRMGSILVEEKKLAHAEDVMLLSIDELCTNAGDPDLAERIALRKEEMSLWKTIMMPNRIETEKDIPAIETELRARTYQKPSVGSLKGMVASRGGMESLSGTALVLKEFDPTASYEGKILVTRHTDPGWTVVFPLVSAIVVERGGLLSHASIVAREMGIPCIIGVAGATDGISDGATISLDFSSGSISLQNV